jgi:hypothetical protein
MLLDLEAFLVEHLLRPQPEGAGVVGQDHAIEGCAAIFGHCSGPPD